jgi:zinc transport system substrate-binding protein
MDSNEIDLLKFREKNVFDDHDEHGDEHNEHGDEHDEHGDEHDEHGDEHGDEHDEHGDEHGDEHDEHGDEHDDHHDGHAHGEFDIHFWLDPEIAKTIVTIVARELSEIDVANKSTYEANAKKAINDLDTLIAETRSKINSDATYIVFHDAYQYFEKRFGIEVIGALTVNPEVLPGARQLAEIREVIEHEKVNCLFSEPQFNPSIAKTIAQDTGVKASVLDPLGAELNPGKDLYFDLIGDMASSFESC